MKKKWNTGILVVAVLSAFFLLAGLLPAAELIPFPKQKTHDQQTIPQPRMQFREEVKGLQSCDELNSLRKKLLHRIKTARSKQDTQYYSGFLADVNQEITYRNCAVNQ